MIYAGGMPRLTPSERLRRLPPLDIDAVRITPGDAASRAALGRDPARVTLLTLLGRPAYRFGTREPVIVFADTGELLEQVTTRDSVALAARFAGAPLQALHYVRALDDADQWTISERGSLPLHKISVDDAAGTELYVSEPFAEVVMVTTRPSRALAWIAAIPHWLYFAPLRLRSALWTRVMIWSSGLAAAGALLGLILSVTQSRVTYRGWMRWHYVLGVLFGVFAVTWTFSGLLSMEPFAWFSRTSSGGANIPQALAGGPLDLSAFPAFDRTTWASLSDGAAIKEITFRRIQGDPYYAITTDRGLSPVIVEARSLRIRHTPFSAESIADRIRQSGAGAQIAETTLLAAYDAYYYDRNRESPLPVVRVKFADEDRTWIYVDGTSQLAARFTARQRLERWLYHGFHSLDFPFWYDRRPLWDIIVITLLAGGTALSVVGVVIAIKRVVRILRLA
jgi:hypothetical protein